MDKDSNKSGYGDEFEATDIKQGQSESEKAYTKEPKTVKVSTLVLAVALTVAVVLMVVFAVLYFTQGNEASLATQATIQTQPLTIAQTVEETEKPTKAQTTSSKKTKTSKKQKATTSVVEKFESYLITVYPPTYIYAGPGYEYECAMILDEQGVYTIVDECYNTKTNSTWGKLKSGVGWINIRDPQYNPNAISYSADAFEPYLVTTYPSTDIYAGPGVEYGWVMTLDEQGVYTIVEECYNHDSHSTWGKLKSGVGWINLG